LKKKKEKKRKEKDKGYACFGDIYFLYFLLFGTTESDSYIENIFSLTRKVSLVLINGFRF
jgi:hypothetical protein